MKNKIEDRWQKEIQRLQGEESDERSTKMTIEETIGVVFSRAAETATNRRFSTTRSYDLIETGTGSLWRAQITLTFSVVRFRYTEDKGKDKVNYRRSLRVKCKACIHTIG